MDDTSSSLMEAHQRLAAVDARLEDVKNELSMTMAEALDGAWGRRVQGRVQGRVWAGVAGWGVLAAGVEGRGGNVARE